MRKNPFHLQVHKKYPKQEISLLSFCIKKGAFCRNSCKNPTKLGAGQVHLASLSIAPIYRLLSSCSRSPVSTMDFNRIDAMDVILTSLAVTSSQKSAHMFTTPLQNQHQVFSCIL